MGITLPPWWSRSYLFDYFAAVITVCSFFIISESINQQTQYFFLDDLDISNPVNHDTIPYLNACLMMVLPVVAIVLLFAAIKRSLRDFHTMVLVMVIGNAATNCTIEVIKLTAGRPRPDFISRCNPLCMQNLTWTCALDNSKYDSKCENTCCPVLCGHDDPRYQDILQCSLSVNGTTYPDVHSGVLVECGDYLSRPLTVTQAQCQGIQQGGEYSMALDGFKSFPSGHSATAIFQSTIFWIYLRDKTAPNGISFFFKVLMAIMGLWVCATRVIDCRHRIQDTVAGGLVGYFYAYSIYGMYYKKGDVSGGVPLDRIDGAAFGLLKSEETKV